MREDIIKFIEKEVETRAKNNNNFFGIGVFYHIKAVVNNAIILAKEYNADVEVVIIAAWLHDIASITKYEYYEDHHIYGAQIAKQILEEFNYDNEKIELVEKCILNHRGSKLAKKQTMEELCVADADAVSHFDNVPSLFYLAYVNRGLDENKGKDFVRSKLQRSYNKLSDKSKELYKQKYENTMMVIG